MNFKALIATLVLGSSSVALASHDKPAPAPAPAPLAAPEVRDHRQLDARGEFRFGFFRHIVEQKPLLLANDRHLMGRAVIKVPTLQTFSKLELKSNHGRTTISRVIIELPNGRRQVVQLAGVVTGKKSLTIDLPGTERTIKSIVLVGNSRGRASIDVVAI